MYVPILAHAFGQGQLYSQFPCKPTDEPCLAGDSMVLLSSLVVQQRACLREHHSSIEWEDVSQGGYIDANAQEGLLSPGVRFLADAIVTSLILNLPANI